MMEKLYQYAIIYVPDEDAREDGRKAEIVKEITNVLAKDEKEVTIKAARDIPEDYLDKLDQVQIAVRAF